MKKILFIFLLIILLASQLVYIDSRKGCFFLTIPAPMPSSWNVKNVLKIVKANDPESYELMCNNITFLSKFMHPSCPNLWGGCFTPKTPRTIYIGNSWDNSALVAAVVVHELCHVRQYLEKRPYEEAECFEKNVSFMEDTIIY